MDFSKYAALAGPIPSYEIPKKVQEDLDRVLAQGPLPLVGEKFLTSVPRGEEKNLVQALREGLAPLKVWVTVDEPGYGSHVALYIRRKWDTDFL